MANYTITLTDAEVKAFETVTPDIKAWLENVGQHRAGKAKAVILANLMSHCNEKGIAMATGEEAQIDQAYDLEVAVKSTQIPPTTP